MKTIELIYTLPKSIINKTFDQPFNGYRKDSWANIANSRYQSLDRFMWWERTKEGLEYWRVIYRKVKDEDDNS